MALFCTGVKLPAGPFLPVGELDAPATRAIPPCEGMDSLSVLVPGPALRGAMPDPCVPTFGLCGPFVGNLLDPGADIFGSTLLIKSPMGR